MVSRYLSSVYRSLGQMCSKKKYHLLANSALINNKKCHLSAILQEISITFGLSLFAFYLFYQLFGNIIMILVLIFGILSSLYGLQDMLLYQPNEPDTARTIVQTPELFHMEYETIIIETADNEKLHGYLLTQMRQSEECATLIFFHGNAGNIGHRLQNAHLLYRTCNINILLFDYRGYGKSTGIPSESGLYTDAQAVYDFVRSRNDLNQGRIILFGRSLGGAVALHLAAYLAENEASPPLHCVIVENTFTSIPDMAKRLFQFFILDYIPTCYYKNLYSSISKIRHIKVPILFLSGEQDELVPPQMMRKLHDECQSTKKQLTLFSDGQHNTTWLTRNYSTQIQKFLTECSTLPSEGASASVHYLLILLFYSNLIASTTSFVLYPPLNHLIEQLTYNSTLPQCTLSTCYRTATQADFSTTDLTHDQLLKLSTYDKLLHDRKPYLISSTGIYHGQRIRYRKRVVDQFLGIYYAEPPRPLEKPVKKRFDYVLQDATKFSACCMQSKMMAENLSYGSFLMQQNFSDNCLSLNIYRADLRHGEKRKAIMLFSHGGSNQLGGGSLFDGSILASEGDIIVITMNFRLNYHGFLSSGDNRVKGNYGLWDQLLAVEWIYENAHLFGGDPKRITLAGHSAGAGNVMLIPASRHCRGMVRRVISQSGTGLAPWSINHSPSKLLERFSREFNCTDPDGKEMLDCIHKLLDEGTTDIYRLHLSLSIADDNPYPVIDNDFINDTIENILRSDLYENVDFLTGVTLNEGLYFAEYHIKHLYSGLQAQSSSMGKAPLRERRAALDRNSTAIIAPDITYSTHLDNERRRHEMIRLQQTTSTEPPLVSELNTLLGRFTNLNYVERYIEANFQHEQCFRADVKQRYELTARGDIIERLKLYIDLVSDLMFNFHMVRCLYVREQVKNKKSTDYAYIYSHRPTFKVRSTFRDQLKILPQAVGHFAELDYVFGVPLARNYSTIHQNVNMSYYNYSTDEINFSRQVIHYWSNFIKTGNPNKNPSSNVKPHVEWKAYTKSDHNYLYFHLNNIHNRPKYFDSMYDFWMKCFQTEQSGGCNKPKIGKYLTLLLHLLAIILILIGIWSIWKYFQLKKSGQLLAHESPSILIPHPNRVSA
ncbi:unnamed protein product [Adineta ricciae]|uniref:Uncharacterized protein n=1 Tax=Adineta ricciae TaxID=249248 RepID=A0A814SAT8_ADIRI|nr:unnamed protein product [Adineta ricciae]CAF1145594.1 unnamed protein product [Adineta ricciae]